MTENEFEQKARDAVKQAGKDLQKSYSDKVVSYRESVEKVRSTVKTLDGFFVKIAKNQKEK
jgi:hypothetical protein